MNVSVTAPPTNAAASAPASTPETDFIASIQGEKAARASYILAEYYEDVSAQRPVGDPNGYAGLDDAMRAAHEITRSQVVVDGRGTEHPTWGIGVFETPSARFALAELNLPGESIGSYRNFPRTEAGTSIRGMVDGFGDAVTYIGEKKWWHIS